MDRKRTIAAASGISVVLVAGSSAFAFANGIFVAHPVSRTGSLQALQARLVPETVPRLRATHAGAGIGSALPAGLIPTVAPVVAPVTMPAVVRTVAAIAPPASAPLIVRAATPTIAHSGPSTVPGGHSEDDHELHEDGHGDD